MISAIVLCNSVTGLKHSVYKRGNIVSRDNVDKRENFSIAKNAHIIGLNMQENTHIRELTIILLSMYKNVSKILKILSIINTDKKYHAL